MADLWGVVASIRRLLGLPSSNLRSTAISTRQPCCSQFAADTVCRYSVPNRVALNLWLLGRCFRTALRHRGFECVSHRPGLAEMRRRPPDCGGSDRVVLAHHGLGMDSAVHAAGEGRKMRLRKEAPWQALSLLETEQRLAALAECRHFRAIEVHLTVERHQQLHSLHLGVV